MNVRSQRLGAAMLCAAGIICAAYNAVPAKNARQIGRLLALPPTTSNKPPAVETLSPPGITDVDLRGPTGGATPADFKYDVATVIHHIERYLAGEHLSTKEMCYVLQAYEQEYRYRMEHPLTVTPLLAFAKDSGEPQMVGFVHHGELSK